MRTRFLATDYFSPSSSSSADQTIALASFRFPSLPLAPPAPDPHFPLVFTAAANLPAADIAEDELDSLPITPALSEFLAAVLPQPLPLTTTTTTDDEGLDEINCEKDGKGDGSRPDGSGASKITKGWKELRFEVVEAEHLPGEVASFDGDESGGGVILSFGVPDVKISLDFVEVEADITIRYPNELVETICQVENIPAKSNGDQDRSSSGDGKCSTVAALDHGVRIPQFEVRGHYLELDECLTGTEISNIFLTVVKHFDGAQVQDSVVNLTEYLRSTDRDMLTLVCDDAPCEDYQEDEPTTVKSAIEMDLMRINDNILLERSSAVYPIKPDGTCSDLPCSILLQELQIIDFPFGDAFEMLVQLETDETDIPGQMFKVDLDQAIGIYDSMVSSELALVDDMFKSLPTPMLSDDKEVKSVLPPIAEVLCHLSPHPLSASDGIYLDWHLLLEGSCNREICSTYASMVEEVNICNLSFELEIGCQQTSAISIDFLEDIKRSAKLHDVDRENKIYIPDPLSHNPPAKLETTQRYRQESSARSHHQMETLNSEKASSLFEAMSQSNGLNFYLDVRRGTRRGTNNENNASLHSISPPKDKELIEIHPVGLSDLILGLINHIHESYKSALEESVYFRNSFSDGQVLSISKQKLLELITGDSSQSFYSHCKDEDKMELIVLYALKQVAYYLCFFGLHAAYLYISNLTGSFANIPERLRNTQCFIGVARQKAEKQLSESHPSLSEIEKILKSNIQFGQNILIVANRAFWLPLGQKLTSMRMTFVELRKYPAVSNLDPVNDMKSATCVLEDLSQSDCILLDINNIPASFPFNKFSIILEYGGPNKSSTLLSLAPNLDGLPALHFLYVKGDTKDLPVALIEGDHTAQDLKSTLDAVLGTLQKDLQEKMNKMRIVDSLNFVPATHQLQDLQEKLNKQHNVDSSNILPAVDQPHKLENLQKKNIVDSLNFVPAAEELLTKENLSKKNVVNSLSFVPAAEKSSSTSSVSANLLKASQDNQSATDLPNGVKFDNIESTRLSSPEVVVVVNTGNNEKNMLFSRRASYQQILALEKGGVQVVERDVDLPVDLILSAAVCFVWYETRTFGSNALSTAEGTSDVTIFVENIATNTLMSLSFSFNGCIMVFEGENHFLSAVMESSDSLYAAAASLDMNLQLFFSHMPESTDEIILSCIRNVTRSNHARYPEMPESESLAESFLTRFPSINPLSAHMILSSGGTLLEFLSWSNERRIQAVGKYLVPPESISLFSSLCTFGELGESKSVMTECSSVDSDISSALLQSPRKRKKCTSQVFAVPTNDPIRPNPLNQLSGDYIEHDKVFSPPKLRKFSEMDDIIPEPPDIFTFGQSLDRRSGVDSYRPKIPNVDTVNGNQIMNDHFSDGLTPNMKKNNERLGGATGTSNFSWQPEPGSKPPTGISLPTSRLAFSSTYSRPMFPTSLEINDDAGDWNISEGTNEIWKGDIFGDVATSSCRVDVGRHHEPTEAAMQNPTGSLAFFKQDFDRHATPHGSGWEIDYLRQMNEKRRARQERGKCSIMRDEPSKVYSPSIESLRYQGDIPSRNQSPSAGSYRNRKGRAGIKAKNHKAGKDSKVQPSINHEKRKEPTFNPTWTPVDKRARQKLSFATYGKEKQSKLVWRHKNSPTVGCSLRKRYRDEGT